MTWPGKELSEKGILEPRSKEKKGRNLWSGSKVSPVEGRANAKVQRRESTWHV